MELETPSKHVPEVAAPNHAVQSGRRSALGWTFALFLVFWVAFYALYSGLPYLKNGSDIVFNAKLRLEKSGEIFPSDPQMGRVLIFGNSKILAGFLPRLFDGLAAAGKMKVASFNSGFPGSDVFLPQLKEMCRRGQAPNVLFLTLPWEKDPPKRDIFHLVQDDHAVIGSMFPFRFWPRDFTDFLMTARGHGGIVASYRDAESDAGKVAADRGYYLITEQSRFPGGRIPDDFHLASDQPNRAELRGAPVQSSQIQELDGLVRQYNIRCYYVPSYYRIGEYAPAPERNQRFADVVENATPCKLVGPDYFLYPNRFFSDQTHLNGAGARVYTAALFQLMESQLSQGPERAVQ